MDLVTKRAPWFMPDSGGSFCAQLEECRHEMIWDCRRLERLFYRLLLPVMQSDLRKDQTDAIDAGWLCKKWGRTTESIDAKKLAKTRDDSFVSIQYGCSLAGNPGSF